MKFELEIRRAVALAYGAPDPYAPEEPEYERTSALFYWIESIQPEKESGSGGIDRV